MCVCVCVCVYVCVCACVCCPRLYCVSVVCLYQANSELIYKSQGLEELEGKMEELREANKQLRDINEVMSSKLQIVEQVKHLSWLSVSYSPSVVHLSLLSVFGGI